MSFAGAVEGANRHKVESVSQIAIEIVFLEFEPLERPLGRFVSAVGVERLDHEALAAFLDACVEDLFYLFQVVRVLVNRVHQLSWLFWKVLGYHRSPLFQTLLQQTGLIVVKQVEHEDAHFYPDVFQLHVLPATTSEGLEGEDAATGGVYGHDFTVHDERLLGGGEVLLHELDDVGIGFVHILQVAGVDIYLPVFVVDLSAKTIVLVFAGEPQAVEALQDHLDVFHRFGQHRLDGHSRPDVADVLESGDVTPDLLQLLNHVPLVRVLADGSLETTLVDLQSLLRPASLKSVMVVERLG